MSANYCLLGRSSHNLQNLGRLITVLWRTTPRRALWRGRGLSPGPRTHKPSSLHGPSGRDSAPVRSGGTTGTSGPVNLGSRSRPVFQARTLCLPSNPLLMSPWHGFATVRDTTLFLFHFKSLTYPHSQRWSLCDYRIGLQWMSSRKP